MKQHKTEFAEESEFDSLCENEVEYAFREVNIKNALPSLHKAVTRNAHSPKFNQSTNVPLF